MAELLSRICRAAERAIRSAVSDVAVGDPTRDYTITGEAELRGPHHAPLTRAS
jgi:hypothetical protein